MRHLVLTFLMLTACGAVVLAAKDQPALAAETADKKAPGKKDQPATKRAGEPVNKFCAVERASEIDPKVTTTHDGKVVGFCCEACVDTFKADPKKYMKDLK